MQVTIKRGQAVTGVFSSKNTFSITVATQLTHEETALLNSRELGSYPLLSYQRGEMPVWIFARDVVNTTAQVTFDTFVAAHSFANEIKQELAKLKTLLTLANQYPPGHTETFEL
jgi:hypothetical protein